MHRVQHLNLRSVLMALLLSFFKYREMRLLLISVKVGASSQYIETFFISKEQKISVPKNASNSFAYLQHLTNV